MGGPYAKKKNNRGYTAFRKQCKTKRKTKDIDEIDEDLKSENAKKLLNQKLDVEQIGGGQFYCLHCGRYFIDDETLRQHFRTKAHKRRLKALELEPYSQKEAEAAAGMGSYISPKKRKIETQPHVQPMNA